MKKILSIFILFLSLSVFSQSADELKKELASKKDSISKLQSKANAIQAKLDAMPGWKKGAFGTIGMSLSGFSNWYGRNAPDASAGNIGVSVTAYANLLQEKFFWRNTGMLTLGWVKLDDKNVAGDEGFETATDVFNFTSLYGRKLNKKWAASGLLEYRTTIIENFNNPGFLDLGVGFTWTPISNLVVVIHPGNYNFVFASGQNVFNSSAGAKIVGDYNAKFGGLSWRSNLSMFQSYESSDFSNWTLTNSLGYTLWKGIGLGFEFGLRKNKQEALTNAQVSNPAETFDTVDNKLQSYWLFGLSYGF